MIRSLISSIISWITESFSDLDRVSYLSPKNIMRTGEIAGRGVYEIDGSREWKLVTGKMRLVDIPLAERHLYGFFHEHVDGTTVRCSPDHDKNSRGAEYTCDECGKRMVLDWDLV